MSRSCRRCSAAVGGRTRSASHIGSQTSGARAAGPDPIDADEERGRHADDVHELVGDADRSADRRTDRRRTPASRRLCAMTATAACAVGVAGAEHAAKGGTHAQHVEVVRRRHQRCASTAPRAGRRRFPRPCRRRAPAGRSDPRAARRSRRATDMRVQQSGRSAVAAHRHADEALLLGDSGKREDQRCVQQRERGNRDRHPDGETADDPEGVAA